jgi:hypothetical protein
MPNKNDLNELYRILGNLEAGQAAIIDRLDRIETQTVKTNGRVTKLENKVFTKAEVEASDGWQQAFNKNLARVGLVMTAVAAAIVAIGNAAAQILKEMR